MRFKTMYSIGSVEVEYYVWLPRTVRILWYYKWSYKEDKQWYPCLKGM